MQACVSALAARLVLALQQRLGELQIPVAEDAPDMGVDRARRVVEAVAGQRRVDRLAQPRGLADDPAVDRLRAGGGSKPGRGRSRSSRRSARRSTAWCRSCGSPRRGRRELDVAPLAAMAASVKRTRRRRTRSISVERVDDVALGLGHLLPLLVADEGVDVDGVERHLGLFMKCRPIIIIRATQKKMMSKPVTSTSVGVVALQLRRLSGQPSVENGHRAEENQVSSTSSSRVSDLAGS
jgi:hypothetical protein